MNKQPYEIVLSFSDQPTVNPERKIRRSRHGCFNCRKRKKKCDEMRPTCSSCRHKCIKCVWPTGNEKVPESYKIPPVDKELLKQKSQEKPLSMVQYAAPEKPRPSSPLRFDDVPLTRTSSSSSSLHSRSTCAKSPSGHFLPSASQSPTDTGTKVRYGSQLESTSSQSVVMEEQLAPMDSNGGTERLYTATASSSISVDGVIGLNEGRQFHQPVPSLDFLFAQGLYDQVLLPTQEEKFMSAGINGFITSLNPQYTHPLLTTNATFTPLIQSNPLLENIAEACGAAFLSWTNPDLTAISSQKYEIAMKTLFNYVNANGYTQDDEIWVAAAFQLLCLGAKVTWGADNSISIRNMKMSHEIICRKISRLNKLTDPLDLKSYKSMPKVMEPNSSTDQYVEGLIKNDSFSLEVESNLGGFTDEPGLTPFMFQFQRIFIESFIYNFSICILVTPDSEGLPNPFEVFRDVRRYLKTPLFTCDVEWMNNPVLGASFDAYEIAAKASYLIRHIQGPWVPDCAQRLLELTENQAPPMLPPNVMMDPIKYLSLRDSILVSEIVLKAARVVLMKTLNPILDATDPMVQREVRSTIFKLRQISPTSSVRVISSWALFVIGLASVDEETRAEIVDACLIIGELVHGRFVYTVMDVLDVAWGRGSKLGNIGYSRGLDVLFDLDMLTKVFI